MKRRSLSFILAMVMVLSLVLNPAYAVGAGDGTEAAPYQIGDTVINDGTAMPDGITVENSYWARTDVPATETVVCQQAEHDHSACEKDAEGNLLCGLEAHTHTQEAGCVTVTEAYTLWTLTAYPGASFAPAPAANEPSLLADRSDGALPIHFFLASPGNITNPNGTYTNYYVELNDANNVAWTIPNIKADANWNTMYSQNGIRNVYEESAITQYVASWPEGSLEAFKDFGSVTIGGRTYYDTDYEIKWVSIMCRDNSHSSSGMRCRQSSYSGEHIHIDGLLVEKIQPGEMEVYKTIPAARNTETTVSFTLQKLLQPDLTSPPTSADAVDSSFAAMTLTAAIPAGETQAQIVGGSEISFGYYKLTENTSNEWQTSGITLTDNRGRTQTIKTDTLYICIAPNGTVQYSTTVSGPYTVMNRVAVNNERKPVTVTYQWKVLDESGYYTELPAGAPSAPAASSHPHGTNYVYDTEYTEGTSFADYSTGLLYTFRGWDVYTHSSEFNVDYPAAGNTALDDGDAVASNNKTVPLTADTYIYGYWEVSLMPPASAHIAIEKVFILNGMDVTDTIATSDIAAATNLWFSIDPGIDLDGDGFSRVDIDYPMIKAANGEYKLAVYQYATPFTFTEHNADVPGYTRTTSVTVTDGSAGTGINAYLKNWNADTNTATVELDEVYVGSDVHLGTITFTNTYTKKTGAAVTEYPTLTLVKRATDTGLLQADAVFTLYSDAACTNAITTFTTDSGGIADIDFETLLSGVSGTYTAYLKETAAPDGYLVDDTVYTLTLTPSTKEELRNNEFVQVTTYALNIAVPANSSAEAVQNAADESKYSLNVYNYPILGEVTVTKEATGLAADDKQHLEATVTVHGPITRDAQGKITGLGQEYTLMLNAENAWTDVQAQLPIGEYLIHENMASVHGYSWDMDDVDYGTLPTEVYNSITSGVFEIAAGTTEIAVTITNTYEAWTAADFYIYKTDPDGTHLSGAVFQLYNDEACTSKVADSEITTSATTRTNGIAWFRGYTVPVDDADGIVTYYLKETTAPAGHYLADTVYRVDIKAVTASDGTTTFEPKLSVKRNGAWVEADGFSNDSDTLAVVNTPVKGQITITKTMNGAPDDLTSVTFYVSGSNGYNKTVTLTKADGWTVTLTDLPLGEYTIVEANADAPGYDLVTTYEVNGVTSSDKATVVLTETNPGKTAENTVFAGTASITNTYTMRLETHEHPTSLTILKVGENNQPLAGAVFTLVRQRDGQTVSYTTNTDGKVQFSFLAGTIENGQVVEGKYTLKETTPPAGYAASDVEWTITVKENDGNVTIKLNEKTNVFEQIWDWIIDNIVDSNNNSYVFTHATATDPAMLTVRNEELADLTISKTFVDAANAAITPPTGAVIEVAVFNSTGGLVQQIELTAANNWTVTLENIPADTYTVRETSPSLHGYTWQSAQFGVTVDGQTATGITTDKTSVQVDVANSDHVRVTITNTYSVWDAVDFYVMKTDTNGNPLPGATFTLYEGTKDVTTEYLHDDPYYHTSTGNTTGSGGILHFQGFTVADGQTAEFILEETVPPTNYYANINTYKVVVDHTTSAYDITVTDMSGNPLTVTNNKATFNRANDVLTVVNEEIKADLVIKKTFPDHSDLVPISVKVDVTGPNGYSNTVVLSAQNGYTVTLKDLSLGKYTVKEQDASHDGYALTVKYNSTIYEKDDEPFTVTLTENHDNIAAVVNIENTYLLDVHNPASFTVKKTDADTGLPLAGAVFSLYDANGTLVGEQKTTGADGTVTFGPFSAAAQYTLKEISAPENYHGTTETWTVTVKEKDGQIEVKLNSTKNAFENIYDWIVEIVTGQSGATWKDGVLTVPNTIKTGSLTISKTVIDPENRIDPDTEYSFTLDCSDDTFDRKAFTLTATAPNNTITITDIPWGTTYTLTENTTGAAFTSSVTDSGNGTIQANTTTITVTNTYRYVENDPGLNLLKLDADTASPIEGVVFALYSDIDCESADYVTGGTTDADGKVHIPIHSWSDAIYYLKETAPAAGYHPNENVYQVTAITDYKVQNPGTANAYTEKQQIITVKGLGDPAVDAANNIKYTYTVENTAIKPVTISVEKKWDDGGYHARPEEVTVTLYRDGVEYSIAYLNEENDWSYVWSGADFTDAYTWTVDEKAADVPAGYVKSVVNEDNSWTITNTRAPRAVEITATKAWNHNGGKDLPDSVSVTLYRNGTAYETKVLSEENDWTYTWTGLTDVYVWSIDETEVPTGYSKEVSVDGYDFVITNTRIINPVEVSVSKTWVASEGVVHPESVEVVLYRDGVEFKTVKLDEKNGWKHTWTGLTDEYTWSVDEKNVPAGYTKNITASGTDFTITNTKNFKYIDVSVNKVWYGADVTHPGSVKVTLYRDGVAYETVTLNAANGWTYTWEDLTDEFVWTVDEPSVPSGYNKTVRQNGTTFTITNIHEDNPKTGIFSMGKHWGILALVSLAVCMTAGFFAILPRKKGKFER